MPLYMTFIDLSKVFYLVSRPSNFHTKSAAPKTVQHDHILPWGHAQHGLLQWFNFRYLSCEQWSEARLYPSTNLLWIFFSRLLQYAFTDCTEDIYLHTRADGKAIQHCLPVLQKKVEDILIHEMLFTYDAVLMSDTEVHLQHLVDYLSYACKEFRLTISLKKTNIMAQDAKSPLNMIINGCSLKMVHIFTYLR